MTLEDRIEKLERQNRRLRWTVTGFVGLGVAALIMGQAAAPSAEDLEKVDVVRARRVEVVDKDGRPVVSIGLTATGTGMITTMDGRGRKAVMLGATANGEGVVATMNRKGEELVKLGATTTGEGVITTSDGKGHKLIEIGVTTKNEPKIYTFNEKGEPKANWP
jgi:hypothetical protein